jgi:hypothetical protein
LQVYFLFSALFLKRKTKEIDIDQQKYVLSFAFGCSTEKCRNNILEQENVF